MKAILVVFFIIFPFSIFARDIKKNFQYENFEKAKKAEEQLQFIVESTKVGIFSSDVDGYVKSYSYSANLDDKNMIMRNMKIIIKVQSMDTDSEDRDKKLHDLCMGYKDYPEIVLDVPGPFFLKGSRLQKLKGSVKIRGKKKPFEVTLKSNLKDGKVLITGNSVWSLKEMEIPDPSIAIAKLSDEIRIKIFIKENIK